MADPVVAPSVLDVVPVGTVDSGTLGLIRDGLKFLAGTLVTAGYMSSTEIPTFIGLGVGLVSLVWSIAQRRKVTKTVAVALAMPKNSDREDLDVKVAETK